MLPPNKDIKNWLECYQRAVNVNVITSVTDDRGVILYVNDKFCKVSGYSTSELIGKTHNIVNSGYHQPEMFRELWSVIKNGKIWTGEIKNKDKTGKFYWVDTVIIPVHLSDKTQYLSLRTLITEKKELEEKKEKYIKSLEELLFMTSHKLRAPLTSILGLTQLNVEKISKKDLKKILQYLKTSTIKLVAFTKDMTEYLYQLKTQLGNKDTF